MPQPLGRLVPSRTNPRYFAVAHAEGVDERLVYLTGSHVNNNFHDGLGFGRDCPEDPERFDFDAYLDLLSERGHNFIRLWRWEQFRGYLEPGDVHFCMAPQPWLRTGPGSAKDGQPRFDLSAFDQTYIRKVIDTVHDLPNVLYEVANESSRQTADSVVLPDGSAVETPIGDSTQWQYWVINSVKDYEREMGYDPHPIGMTYLFPVDDLSKANEPLWNSPADWISPGFDDTFDQSRWLIDPPANNGSKVVLLDTDHFSPFSSTAVWVWKSFLRGHNPILYDLGILSGGVPAHPSEPNPSFDSLEPARRAMGDARGFAERIRLTTMLPRPEVGETGFALADPGNAYVILQPSETGDPISMTLTPGRYAVEWHSLGSRETVPGAALTVADANPISLRAPFEAAGPAVVHLRRIAG